jgi:hypothetical protein
MPALGMNDILVDVAKRCGRPSTIIVFILIWGRGLGGWGEGKLEIEYRVVVDSYIGVRVLSYLVSLSVLVLS